MTRNDGPPSSRNLEDLSPLEAREAIADVLKGGEALESLYEALSAWVWSTLNSRRNDPELREWLRIFKATQARLAAQGESALAERLHALGDLIYRTVRTSDTTTDAELLSKRHVQAILHLLFKEGGVASRKYVLEKAGLLQANLTRIAILMESAGLLTRRTHGREVEYELTRRGLNAANTAQRPSHAKAAGLITGDKAALVDALVEKLLAERHLALTAVADRTRRHTPTRPDSATGRYERAPEPHSRSYSNGYYTRGVMHDRSMRAGYSPQLTR